MAFTKLSQLGNARSSCTPLMVWEGLAWGNHPNQELCAMAMPAVRSAWR